MKQQAVKFFSRLLLAFSCLFLFATTFSRPVHAAERTKIVFWHEMTGPAKEQLVKFCNEFNKSQDKYTVVPEFEGDYNQVVQKVLNTHGTNTSPALFQSMDISTDTDALQQLYNASTKIY